MSPTARILLSVVAIVVVVGAIGGWYVRGPGP